MPASRGPHRRPARVKATTRVGARSSFAGEGPGHLRSDRPVSTARAWRTAARRAPRCGASGPARRTAPRSDRSSWRPPPSAAGRPAPDDRPRVRRRGRPRDPAGRRWSRRRRRGTVGSGRGCGGPRPSRRPARPDQPRSRARLSVRRSPSSTNASIRRTARPWAPAVTRWAISPARPHRHGRSDRP